MGTLVPRICPYLLCSFCSRSIYPPYARQKKKSNNNNTRLFAFDAESKHEQHENLCF